ncbi:hypothetical protein LCGC14_0223950 [marine sediment metagenome]|uniref:Uncharacterized protein n=1 Tax=marine sediment metagenome TaxID=412755 RepID=A0A0F9UTL9_9ZZZZ
MVRGVEYQTDEATDALYICEIEFDKKFCVPQKTDMVGERCLNHYFSDGFDRDGISYVVRNYSLGIPQEEAEVDNKDIIDIGIVTDGEKCWWFYPEYEGAIRGLASQSRIFYEKEVLTMREWLGE